MRSAPLLFVALLASIGCKKAPPVEDPGDLGLGSGTGSGTGTADAPDDRDPPPADDGVPDELRAAMEGYVSALEAVSVAAFDAGPDCLEMEEGLRAAGQAGMPAMKKFEAYPEATLEEHMPALMAQFGERIDRAVIQLGEAVEPCEDDEGVANELALMGLGS